MKIKLDLYHPYELEAFAAFSAAVAAGKAAYDAAQPKDTFGLAGLVGGIERAQGVWKTAEPAEAPDASHITTQENSSVATPAPAEKKTRGRKPKDAPAVSIPSTDSGVQTDIETAIAAGKAYDATVAQQVDDNGKAAISTGNERVGPEDSAAVSEQDAADEAAETAATKTGVTLDDIRDALKVYSTAYGLEAVMTDGPKVITLVCGDGAVKVSDVPDDKIAAVIAGVKEMVEKNPFSRQKVAA